MSNLSKKKQKSLEKKCNYVRTKLVEDKIYKFLKS